MSHAGAAEAPEAVIVGAGVIGLAVALELANRGATSVLVGESRRGQASAAAAGMLAPSVEPLAPEVREFATRARDRYPGYIERLEALSGMRVALDRAGILEVTRHRDRAARLWEQAAAGAAEWIDSDAVAALEPQLSEVAAALLHRDDGAVDNVALMEALEIAVGRERRIRRVTGAVSRLHAAGTSPHVAAGNESIAARYVVLAGGAWSAGIAGLPRALPVEPLRGQLLVLQETPVRHVVYGDEGYLVPRRGGTLVGATMERAGFDPSTTETGLAALHAAAGGMCPALGSSRRVDAWAGLRPATPDLLPILGVEPRQPSLLYACGHSRNGILMAPLTADCIAALITGDALPCSLEPFAVSRFRDDPADGAPPA